MEHTYRPVMRWLTLPNSVYKYVPDVNDTMSQILKAFTSLRKYQGVITHFLWEIKIIKICFRHPTSDVLPNVPLVIIKERKMRNYHHKLKVMCMSHLLQLTCNKIFFKNSKFLMSSVHGLFDEKITVQASKYFQYKPTRGCSRNNWAKASGWHSTELPAWVIGRAPEEWP